MKAAIDLTDPTARLRAAPRCTATAKGTRERCKCPAVTGWRVCRTHGARGGGPRGERNGRYAGGLWTKEMIEERRRLSELLKEWRAVIDMLEPEAAQREFLRLPKKSDA